MKYCILSLVLLTNCGAAPPRDVKIMYKVVYSLDFEIRGSAPVVMPSYGSLTYLNEQGGTSQESNAHLPWTLSFVGKTGRPVYISAQNLDHYGNRKGRPGYVPNAGEVVQIITVEIYVDGALVKTSSSKGAYAIATASGTL